MNPQPPNPFAFPGAVVPPEIHSQARPAQDEFHPIFAGMTLRDYFAAQAFSSLVLSSARGPDHLKYPPDIAAQSYKFADAMLAQRVREDSSQ